MSLRRKFDRANLGQSVTELALVLPIILFLVYGVFELGRVVFIFSSLNNATREAARYGAAAGLTDSGAPSYLDCAAIRRAARESAFLAGLNDGDIQIAYDTPVSGTMNVFANCGEAGLGRDDISQGDRIVVDVNKTVEPILPILPSGGFSLNFSTARTILKDIVIGPVECSDDLDNDGDGTKDHDGGTDGTPDLGCSSPDDTTEAFCYRLSVVGSPPEGGNLGIQPDPNCANRYIEQTTAHLTASPTERYVFKRWSGDHSTTDNPTSLIMDSDKDIVAEFRLRTSDLHVEKEAPLTVYAEKPFTYNIFVTNLYTETARDLVITDTLPADLQLDSWSIDAGDCPTATATQFICEVTELPAGSMVTLSINVRAPSNINYVPATITNTVTASTGPLEHDPDLSNNTDTATTEVRPRAELEAISKEGPSDPVYAVTFFDYTVTVGNLGPSIATDVTITDQLQNGLKFVSSVSGCVGSGTPPTLVTCEIGDLSAGATTSVVFTVEAPRNGQSVPNAATVSGNEYEDDTSDNTVSLVNDTEVVSRADLELNKGALLDAVRDVPLSYDLAVRNNGPSDAVNVEIVDTLPTGVDYLGYSSTTGNCTVSGSTVTCDMGTVDGYTTESVTLDVRPTVEGTITNTATVDSTTHDHAPGNESDSASTTVTTDVNLTISKTDSADPVSEGDAFTYTIRVDNNGASNATSVEVMDSLPEGVEYNSADAPTGWSCSASSSAETGNMEVTCTPPDGVLPGGQGATITINVTAADAGTFTNYARIDAAEDAAGTEELTEIEPVLDLSLNLTAATEADVGVPFSYTMTVANSGLSDATSVVVASQLDDAVTFDTVAIDSGDGWACSYDLSTHRVVCTAITMAPNSNAAFTITVTPNLAVDVISEGVVSADESSFDSDPGNDADSAITTINAITTTGTDD